MVTLPELTAESVLTEIAVRCDGDTAFNIYGCLSKAVSEGKYPSDVLTTFAELRKSVQCGNFLTARDREKTDVEVNDLCKTGYFDVMPQLKNGGAHD